MSMRSFCILGTKGLSTRRYLHVVKEKLELGKLMICLASLFFFLFLNQIASARSWFSNVIYLTMPSEGFSQLDYYYYYYLPCKRWK